MCMSRWLVCYHNILNITHTTSSHHITTLYEGTKDRKGRKGRGHDVVSVVNKVGGVAFVDRLQVCQKYMPVSSLIIGVDLKPIKGLRGIVSLTHDITTQACRTALKKETQGWQVCICPFACAEATHDIIDII
jgi:hypothetical protein